MRSGDSRDEVASVSEAGAYLHGWVGGVVFRRAAVFPRVHGHPLRLAAARVEANLAAVLDRNLDVEDPMGEKHGSQRRAGLVPVAKGPRTEGFLTAKWGSGDAMVRRTPRRWWDRAGVGFDLGTPTKRDETSDARATRSSTRSSRTSPTS